MVREKTLVDFFIDKLQILYYLNTNKVTAAFDGERRNLFLFLLVSLVINFTAVKFLIGGAKQGSGAIGSIKPENPSIGAAERGSEKVVFASLGSLSSDSNTSKKGTTTTLPIASKANISVPVNSSKQSPSIGPSSGDSHTQISGAEVIEQKGSNPQDVPNTSTNSQFSFDGMPAMPLAVPGTTSRGLFSRPPEVVPIPQAVSDPKQLVQSKRIQMQAQVTLSLSKAREQWNRNRPGLDCLVWVDPNWNQFAVDCKPEEPARSELVFLLTNMHLSYSPNASRSSWHCVKVGSVQGGRMCPE